MKWYIFSTGIEDVKNITNPLEKVQAGLVSNSDAPVPLKSVHVRGQLQDLASQVCFALLSNINSSLITQSTHHN